MHFDKSQVDIARLLSKVSPIYQNLLQKDIQRMPLFKDGYNALVLFLNNYAYARQGAPKAYSKIAVKCISDRHPNGSNWGVPTRNDAKYLWEDYKRIAKNDYHLLDNRKREEEPKVKVNETRNPMNEDEGVIDKLASSKTENISIYVRDLIRSGRTSKAYNFIKGIRGIGEKITSFYLRDIVYLAGLDEESISDLHLLQPIDTWLEQTLKILFGSDVPKDLQEKQELIVALCKESKVSSVSFNQGAWMLGSQIAGEFDTFKKALMDYESARKIIEDHMEEKEGYLCVVKNVLDNLH